MTDDDTIDDWRGFVTALVPPAAGSGGAPASAAELVAVGLLLAARLATLGDDLDGIRTALDAVTEEIAGLSRAFAPDGLLVHVAGKLD